jgi:hypothetical protein
MLVTGAQKGSSGRCQRRSGTRDRRFECDGCISGGSGQGDGEHRCSTRLATTCPTRRRPAHFAPGRVRPVPAEATPRRNCRLRSHGAAPRHNDGYVGLEVPRRGIGRRDPPPIRRYLRLPQGRRQAGAGRRVPGQALSLGGREGGADGSRRGVPGVGQPEELADRAPAGAQLSVRRGFTDG